MVEGLPTYVHLTFIIVVACTYVLVLVTLYRAFRKLGRANPERSVVVIGGILMGWLALQGVLAGTGFYLSFDGGVPRIVYAIVPGLIVMITAVTGRFGFNALAQALPLGPLHYLHGIRVPIELVLLWLFHTHLIPEIMTFEGRNFDILAGLTAPFIAYFSFTKPKLPPRVILIWNYFALALLVNIVATALLSVPTPVQIFGLDQPNLGLGYFPFVWLATFIVPVVFIAHVCSIKQLRRVRAGSPST